MPPLSTAAVALLAVLVLPAPHMQGATPPPSCATEQPASRWLPGAEGYRATAEYGVAMEEWIGSLAGMAAAGGRVFLLDQGDPRVVVLDERLRPEGEFGRSGQGPGEFERPMVPWSYTGPWDFWYLAATRGELAVYDREAIEIFDHQGRFLRRHGGIPRDPLFGLRYLAYGSDGALLYAFDRIDRRRPGRRSLETWRAGPEAQLLWEVALAPPPHSGAGYVTPIRQARPLWALGAGCVFVSAGSDGGLVRLELETGAQDTLVLPNRPVPSTTPEERAEGRARARAGLPGAELEPTRLMHWADMTMDPDGFLWLERWRPDRTGPAEVVVLHPGTGAVTELRLPAFPKAFGDPGIYYGVHIDPETDQARIVRYDREQGGRSPG